MSLPSINKPSINRICLAFKTDLKAARPEAAFGFHGLCSTCHLLGQYSSLQASILASKDAAAAAAAATSTATAACAKSSGSSQRSGSSSSSSECSSGCSRAEGASSNRHASSRGCSCRISCSRKDSLYADGNKVTHEGSAQECLSLATRLQQLKKEDAQLMPGLDAAPSSSIDVSTHKGRDVCSKVPLCSNPADLMTVQERLERQRAVLLSQMKQRAEDGDHRAALGLAGMGSNSAAGSALQSASAPGPGNSGSSSSGANGIIPSRVASGNQRDNTSTESSHGSSSDCSPASSSSRICSSDAQTGRVVQEMSAQEWLRARLQQLEQRAVQHRTDLDAASSSSVGVCTGKSVNMLRRQLRRCMQEMPKLLKHQRSTLVRLMKQRADSGSRAARQIGLILASMGSNSGSGSTAGPAKQSHSTHGPGPRYSSSSTGGGANGSRPSSSSSSGDAANGSSYSSLAGS